MNNLLQDFIQQHRPQIEKELFDNLPLSNQNGAARYNDALQYALFPGGKRWRPILTLLGGMVVGASVKCIISAACAIEYLHTSSMIIDDLPSMDDADLRRGKPAMHLAYNESTAMLVSLALMNQSYSLMAKTCKNSNHLETTGRLITQATECIGADGMVGGQVIDLELRGDYLSDNKLESRNLKTNALMRLMMTAGPIAINAHEAEITALSQFGEALGTAYQIYDDLLDELGETRTIGKTLKQDRRHLCPSYISVYGVGAAKKMAVDTLKAGTDSLRQQFGHCTEVSLLIDASYMIVKTLSMPMHSIKYETVALY